MSTKSHMRLTKWEAERLSLMTDNVNKLLKIKGFPEVTQSEVAHLMLKTAVSKYRLKVGDFGELLIENGFD